ncbi:MAG: hypothetical protein JXR45_24785 [Deltaproteobacteria bacterium]|nr:hypothetical protein [Deltaproteobacteria bacterium]
MEHSTQNEKPLRAYFDPQSLPIMPYPKKVLRLFVDRGREEPYKVTIVPTESSYELRGTVDSQWTHDVVLTMVPHFAKYRIIDRLNISDHTLLQRSA